MKWTFALIFVIFVSQNHIFILNYTKRLNLTPKFNYRLTNNFNHVMYVNDLIMITQTFKIVLASDKCHSHQQTQSININNMDNHFSYHHILLNWWFNCQIFVIFSSLYIEYRNKPCYINFYIYIVNVHLILIQSTNFGYIFLLDGIKDFLHINLIVCFLFNIASNSSTISIVHEVISTSPNLITINVDAQLPLKLTKFNLLLYFFGLDLLGYLDGTLVCS